VGRLIEGDAVDRTHRSTITAAEPNEISRASMGGSAAAAAGGSALTEPGPSEAY